MEKHLKQIDRKLYAISQILMIIIRYHIIPKSFYAKEINEELQKIVDYLSDNDRQFIGQSKECQGCKNIRTGNITENIQCAGCDGTGRKD